MKKLPLSLVALAACTASENVGNTAPHNDDVDAAVFARVPVFGQERWHVVVGGAHQEYAGPAAVAADGDLLFAGTFQDTVDLGLGPVSSPTTVTLGPNAETIYCNTAFLTKRSRIDGSLRWLHVIPPGVPNNNNCVNTTIGHILVDASGAIFLVGEYSGTADFGTHTLETSLVDVFVAKYSSDGEELWVSGLGPSSHAYDADAVLRSDGTLAVLGRFRGTFDTPTGPIGNDAYEPAEAFLTTFSVDGQMSWTRELPSTTANEFRCSDIAAAPGGDILVGCSSRQPYSFGGATIAVIGQRGMLARYSEDGELVWSKGVGEEISFGQPPSIAITSTGLILTVGLERPEERAQDNAIIRAFDAAGNEVWMRRTQSGRAVASIFALDASDRLILAGQGRSSTSPADFGLGAISLNDAFLLAVASDGTPLDQVVSSEPPYLGFLAPLPDGSIAYSGYPGGGTPPFGLDVDITFGVFDPPP